MTPDIWMKMGKHRCFQIPKHCVVKTVRWLSEPFHIYLGIYSLYMNKYGKASPFYQKTVKFRRNVLAHKYISRTYYTESPVLRASKVQCQIRHKLASQMIFQVSEGCYPSAHIYIKMSRWNTREEGRGVWREMITSSFGGRGLFGKLGVSGLGNRWRCENHINVKRIFPLEFKSNNPELVWWLQCTPLFSTIISSGYHKVFEIQYFSGILASKFIFTYLKSSHFKQETGWCFPWSLDGNSITIVLCILLLQFI